MEVDKCSACPEGEPAYPSGPPEFNLCEKNKSVKIILKDNSFCVDCHGDLILFVFQVMF